MTRYRNEHEVGNHENTQEVPKQPKLVIKVSIHTLAEVRIYSRFKPPTSPLFSLNQAPGDHTQGGLPVPPSLDSKARGGEWM